jgi:hypothetical protein
MELFEKIKPNITYSVLEDVQAAIFQAESSASNQVELPYLEQLFHSRC